MEIALFLALWSGAFTLWNLVDRGRNDPLKVLAARALLLGASGAALVATRPEAAATTFVREPGREQGSGCVARHHLRLSLSPREGLRNRGAGNCTIARAPATAAVHPSYARPRRQWR